MKRTKMLGMLFQNYNMRKKSHVIPERHDFKIVSYWKFKASKIHRHMHFWNYMSCGSGTTYLIPEPHLLELPVTAHHLPRLIQYNLAGEENNTKNVPPTAEKPFQLALMTS